MKIFVRKHSPTLPPEHNPAHSAHPPYLFSGRKALGYIRMNPFGMMKASFQMYRKRGLMKHSYALWLDRIVMNVSYHFQANRVPDFLDDRAVISESYKLWESRKNA